jgi:hypothetical protein
MRGWKVVIVRGFNRASCILMLVIAMAPTLRVSAQSVQDPRLQKLVQTPQYQANIARLFAAFPSDVFQRCPGLVSNGSSVTVIQPTSFATDGYPVSGIWKQSFPVSGCGNDTTINFFFTAQADEKITSQITAPGETHANPILQRDALGYAIMAVRGKTKTCNDPHLRTTRFDGQLPTETNAGKRPTKAGGWSETWILSACGQIFAVPLTFIPDATGTQITAAPAIARS